MSMLYSESTGCGGVNAAVSSPVATMTEMTMTTTAAPPPSDCPDTTPTTCWEGYTDEPYLLILSIPMIIALAVRRTEMSVSFPGWFQLIASLAFTSLLDALGWREGDLLIFINEKTAAFYGRGRRWGKIMSFISGEEEKGGGK